MQQSLDGVSVECKALLVIINPIKCEILISSPAKRPITYPDLSIDGIHLPVVSETKLLGVYINSSLKWDSHVEYMCKKVRKCFFILYRAKQFKFNFSTMFTLYSWFIRTSLEYATPVWHPGISTKHSLTLERIQKRCFRVILGN